MDYDSRGPILREAVLRVTLLLHPSQHELYCSYRTARKRFVWRCETRISRKSTCFSQSRSYARFCRTNINGDTFLSLFLPICFVLPFIFFSFYYPSHSLIFCILSNGLFLANYFPHLKMHPSSLPFHLSFHTEFIFFPSFYHSLPLCLMLFL
jgi:hypothetical protein